ncbi:hypothetical protein BLSTO_02323 [Blastocystis sp. subtype 1]
MSISEFRGNLSLWLNKEERVMTCIEFYSLHSEECKEIAQPFSIMARKYSKGLYVRINGERYVEEVKACNVTTFPTFIFYFCGEERERLEKADAYLLEAKIQQYTQLVLPENEDDRRSDDSSEESREISTDEDDYMDHYPFERVRNDYFGKAHILGGDKQQEKEIKPMEVEEKPTGCWRWASLPSS